MSVFWVRRRFEAIASYGESLQRRPKTHSYRPRSGGFQALLGQRCDTRQGERIVFASRLAKEGLKTVQTASIYKYRT